MPSYRSATEEQPMTYEGDIQPLVSNYFNAMSNSGLSGGAQIRAVEAERNRLQVSAARDLELKQRAQQFEVTRLQLEDARRKSVSALGMNEAVDNLGQQLTMALKAPEEQRKVIVSQIGINLAPLIANNETAKFRYNAALSATTGTSRATSDDKAITSMMSGLDSVKMGEDQLKRPINEFKDPVSAGKVTDIIDIFGTPEEQQAAADASPIDKFGIARSIRSKYMKSKVQGVTPQTQAGPKSLFAKQPTLSP